MRTTKKIILSITAIISVFFTIQSVFAGDLFYVNGDDGNRIWKKDSETSGNGSAVTVSNASSEFCISRDGTKIAYRGPSDYLYLKNANDVSDGTAITTVGAFKCVFSQDNNFIFYLNGADSYRVWKKNANDVSNGVSIFSAPTGVGDIRVDIDGQHIYYATGKYPGPTYGVYKKNINDTNTGTLILQGVGDFNISNDGIYMVYAQPLWDTNKLLYKKLLSDSGTGSVISNLQYSSSASFSTDGQSIFYVKGHVGYPGIYKKNANDVSTGSLINTALSKDPQMLNVLAPPNVDGICGSAIGVYPYGSTTYTGSLCETGTASGYTTFPLLGEGALYSCIGTGTGISSSCGIYQENLIFNDPTTPDYMNGLCGTSAKTYTASETDFTGTLCASGTASLTPSFPLQGSSASWQCLGLGVGSTMSCIAYRKVEYPINGSCGSSAKTYTASETDFTGTLCASGTASLTPSFPLQGSSASWQCLGLYGGSSGYCTATRNSDTSTGSWFPDFSSIGSGIASIGTLLSKLTTFNASWIGFNFSVVDLKNMFSTNFTALGVSIYDASGSGTCGLYTQPIITYSFTSYIAGPSSTTYQTGTGRSLPSCNTSYLSSTDNPVNGFEYNNELSWTNGNACTVSAYVVNGMTSSSAVRQWERKFKYVVRNNDSKVINYNQTILNTLRIIPFTITIFGWDLGEFINSAINGALSFIIEIIFYPINSLSEILNDFRVFWASYPETYCFYGMKISKLSIGNTQNFIDSDTPYTTTLGIGAFLVIIFLIGFFRKIIKSI